MIHILIIVCIGFQYTVHKVMLQDDNQRQYADMYTKHLKYECQQFTFDLQAIPVSEIALSWSPMRLKSLLRRPEFHNWSPAGN